MRKLYRRKCLSCENTAPKGHKQCAACRRTFKALDTEAMDTRAIHRDMREAGIPTRRIQYDLPAGFQYV